MATIVAGDQKAHFSIASTPNVGVSVTIFLELLHFTLDTCLILLGVNLGGLTRPEIEHWSLGPLRNNLPTWSMRLRAILNKSWKQHPTKQQLYSHQPLITKTIKIRRARQAGHC